MKLLSKVFLTLFVLFLLLVGLWLSLPAVLAGLAERQLAEYGFSDVEVNIASVGIYSTVIERLIMSNDSMQIKLKGLQADYRPGELLDGKLTAVEANKLVINRLTSPEETVLPDPVLLSTLLGLPLQKYIPADTIRLKTLSLYEKNGSLSLTGSVDVSKQGKNTLADVMLDDSTGKQHQIKLLDSPDAGLDIQWQVAGSEIENPVSASIHRLEDGLGLVGTATINLAGIAGLTAGLDDLSGEVQAGFSFIEQSGSKAKILKLDATITDAGLAGSQVETVAVDMTATILEKDNGFSMQFSPSSIITMKDFQQGQNRAAELTIKFPHNLDIVDSMPVFERANEAEVRLRDVMLDTIHVPEMQLSNIFISSQDKTGKSSEQGKKGGSAACSINMKLVAPDIQLRNTRLHTSPVKLDIRCPASDDKPWTVLADSKAVTIEDDDFKLSLSGCQLTVNSNLSREAEKSQHDISGKMACEGSFKDSHITTRFQVNTEAGSGQADYVVDGVQPDSETQLIGSLLKNWQQPYDIVSGKLSLKGRYSWWKTGKGRSREKLTMNMKLDDAAGYYEEILFTGIDFNGRFEILPSLKSLESSPLTIRNIDIGMPIDDLRADILLSTARAGSLPAIKINGLSMSVFDGKITGNDLIYDLNKDENSLILVAVGLDLSQIVEMQQVDGLTATGRLDGYIPVTITENGVRIDKGKIVAQSPGGEIHYRPAGGTGDIEQSAVGSEFVFRILEDLDYNALNIDVDYSVDGEMEIMLMIRGMSPKVDKKRPVHINLNLQQNVLKLLRALRYADKLSEDIDKNLQKHFRKNKKRVN